ncbi:APC family permease [Umboniibacter marinipuniceus]|uniref:Amino acid/polyamine/organocation transporter (APC superfamily) n=1 Tax=Umboniibacter marinipuniceus TaxID=569599 RepID=A0A3M0AUG7_9GAMM|nr:APC family permease [Umboniibacter marinipuniceus]RMA82602.1 amino acid/polyamine/organocation transporter (APC superfamily) [Umboniibacter marinipuniceus]
MEHRSELKLKRNIGTGLLTLYGLGTILGAGIYILVGKVAGYAGIYAPAAFLLAALLATLSGYSYAKLSARYPKSAGEVVYVQNAFHLSALSRAVGWLVVLTGVVSAATITRGFVGYLQVFIDVPYVLAITGLVLIMTLLAIWGAAESVIATSIATILGLIGLAIVLFYSAPHLINHPESFAQLIPPAHDSSLWFGIVLGAFLAFYAFIGFEDIVNMAEEVKEPEKAMPTAIMLAIIVSSLLYVLVAIAAVSQLSIEALRTSSAPLADVMQQHSPTAARVVSLISLAAIINGALVQIIMGSRVLFGMASQGLAPQQFAVIHASRRTPYVSTAVIGSVVWVLASGFELTLLAKITSFIIIVIFFLVNVSLLRLIKRDPSLEANPLIPALGALICIGFLASQIYQLFTTGFMVSH